MRIIRCFLDAELQVAATATLSETVSNHLFRVLRLGIGDSIHLFNGDGFDYVGEIQSAEKRGGKVLIHSSHALGNESPLSIHVYQSIARGEKMDLILQKATELGVSAFTPMVSDRTEVKLDNERSEKKRSHWLGVIRAACEQSGRARVPVLNEAIAIHQLSADSHFRQAFYLQPGAELRLSELPIEPKQPVIVAIGPEGGFSERDIHLLQQAGFRGLQMGPRILRTETAGIALIAALQSHYGDW
jgi:16S rRNA (uracil1498-N3)-methyltransferase